MTDAFAEALAASTPAQIEPGAVFVPRPCERAGPHQPQPFRPGDRFTVIAHRDGVVIYTPSPVTSEQVADMVEARALPTDFGLFVLQLPQAHFVEALAPESEV